MAKTSWPEVVGWPELNVLDQIELDRPDVSVGFYMQALVEKRASIHPL
jgi:hypothetical protein